MGSPVSPDLSSPAAVSQLLTTLYPDLRGFKRLLLKYRPYICPFHELLPYIPPASRVLDVGCGIGIMTALANASGRARDALAFDASADAIVVARRAAWAQRPEIHFERVDATSGWPAYVPDVVVCVDVLHHIAPGQQRAFVRRLAESCPAGKRLVFKDISPRPAWKAAMNGLHDLVLARQRVHHLAEDRLGAWLVQDGFDLREQKRLDQLWYGHYLVVADKRADIDPTGRAFDGPPLG
jgi:2-polyprenyl-3-methyl-5-hydroxy-6-metoxy-1,4-benzoquinol methylase